jgi:predicted  nucleic acid-binding Zn-ribbon protein
MSQEVVQWLNEIKDLKQQISQLQVELANSEASGDKWRKLYETEAQQRRQDAQQAQQQIADLEAQVQTIVQGREASALEKECDRLMAALAEEKADHEQTRKNLTTALADAMELISKGNNRLPDVALDP